MEERVSRYNIVLLWYPENMWYARHIGNTDTSREEQIMNREDVAATATTQGIEVSGMLNGYRVHTHFIGYGYTFDEAIDAFMAQYGEKN